MQLSQQQSDGLEAVRDWFDDIDRAPVFRFFGFAGTGKTTIAQMFSDIVEGRVLFACYTGKAAHVLREKGCHGATTLHSLIYQPKGRSAQRLRDLQREYIELEGRPEHNWEELEDIQKQIKLEQENVKRPSFGLKPDSELQRASLLVIDEVSMVDETMGEDLLSFGIPILCLGDPAQLPPVKGGGFFTDQEPDVLLTEVHRQAADSPILALATEVREGRGYGSSPLVVPRGQSVEFMAGFDQILCGTNRTRKIVNEKIREHRGFSSVLPQSGDRLICTRNDAEVGLLNGSQWSVLDARWCNVEEELSLTIQSCDSDEQMTVQAHPEYFLGEEPPYFMIRKKQCFDFAYAMTVHKSQGSGFERVCLIDEAARFPAHQRKAWRYTGITRASKELTIIK